MVLIDNFINEINYIISIIKNAFNIDIAVFNTDCKLLVSTKAYLQNKGNSVHAPSILEVMESGRTIVNTPGSMPSCQGCRFKDNCPATIELLNCIKISNTNIGVIAFTSFTEEGHDRIIKNIDRYTSLIDDFSQLTSSLIYYKNRSNELESYRHAVSSALELADEGFILADENGDINIINNYALDIFGSCNLHTKSIYQLFDNNTLPAITSRRVISNMNAKINDNKIKISANPINLNNKNIGVAIKITNKIMPLQKIKEISNEDNPFLISNIKGKSEYIRTLKQKVLQIQHSPSTILITGDTGTGKGLLAKAIHYESSRKNKPFVVVNCSSIPETLFESELFGYESGAFTGAKKEGKPGKFELANEGTLFLDEIGEMPMNLQAKLLNVLQDSTFERVGGITPIHVNVRIIAATNKNILKLIEEKKFRSDLYYRLNVIPIELPSLCKRKEDIVIIANDFLNKCSIKLNKEVKSFEKDVLEMFQTYDWPGNIRQLENVVEYAANMSDSKVISINDLPNDFLNSINQPFGTANQMKKNEYNLIVQTIDKYGWDVKGKTLAANELGIGIRTLYRKLNNNIDKKI